MTKINFDLNRIKNLSPTDMKKYVDEYFIPLNDGNHAFFVNGKWEIIVDKVIKNTYFKRMPAELTKYYFSEKTDLRSITFDINKPQLYDGFLNMCPKILHEYKPYKDFSEDIKGKVNLMLNHIKEVLCSNKTNSYEFLIKWFSNMVRGNRNDSALYLKGLQGAGKSTPIEFIRDFVIGRPLAYQGGSGPLKNHFNSELSGRLMVMFEELENFSASEWMSISSVLKRQITSKTIMIERKGKDQVEEINLNNYILLSNNDAIQDDDGRRYFILDINTKYIGNKAYFDKLYRDCCNLEVGKAFYCYLMEIDISKYKAQDYPLTTSKLDSYTKRLDNVFKFLKDRFILCKVGIPRTSVGDYFAQYQMYCQEEQLKAKTKIDFNKSLESIGISYYASSGKNYYKVSLETLNEIAEKFHWIHALDEYEDMNGEAPPKEETVLKTEHDELKKQLEELKAQNKQLVDNAEYYKNKKKERKTKPKVEPVEQTDEELEAELLKMI